MRTSRKAILPLLFLLMPTVGLAEPYVIMDRLNSSRPNVLGIAGLYPDGCPSDFTGCSNIVVTGIVERIGYVDGEDFPNLLVVKDQRTGFVYPIQFPYQEIWDGIGTADASWVGRWLKVGSKVTVIGIIGGSQGNISIDSIYLTDFINGSLE